MRFFYPVSSLLFFSMLVMDAGLVFAQQVELRTFCAAVTEGDADYVPGVDVHSKPVVPADVEKPLQAIQYPISIPIEVITLEWLDVDILDGKKTVLSDQSGTKIVSLELFEDGHIEYSGQDISDRVSHACRNDPEQPTIHSDGDAPDGAAPPSPSPSPSTAAPKPEAPASPPSQKTDAQPAAPVTESSSNPALSEQ